MVAVDRRDRYEAAALCFHLTQKCARTQRGGNIALVCPQFSTAPVVQPEMDQAESRAESKVSSDEPLALDQKYEPGDLQRLLHADPKGEDVEVLLCWLAEFQCELHGPDVEVDVQGDIGIQDEGGATWER